MRAADAEALANVGYGGFRIGEQRLCLADLARRHGELEAGRCALDQQPSFVFGEHSCDLEEQIVICRDAGSWALAG
jgi:hypothetical protein